jgi:hypothetical protein
MKAAAMRKENCEEEHNKLPSDPLEGCSSLSSHHQSSPTQLHCQDNTSNQRHCRQLEKACGTLCSSTCHNRKYRKQVYQSNNDMLKVATVVQQITTTKMVLNETKWLLEF